MNANLDKLRLLWHHDKWIFCWPRNSCRIYICAISSMINQWGCTGHTQKCTCLDCNPGMGISRISAIPQQLHICLHCKCFHNSMRIYFLYSFRRFIIRNINLVNTEMHMLKQSTYNAIWAENDYKHIQVCCFSTISVGRVHSLGVGNHVMLLCSCSMITREGSKDLLHDKLLQTYSFHIESAGIQNYRCRYNCQGYFF